MANTSHCSVPGCFGAPVFAGLCNHHCTRQPSEPTTARNIPQEVVDNAKLIIKEQVAKMPDLSDPGRRSSDTKMSFRYPKYYKEIPHGVTELDIYMTCHIFRVEDHSGCLHHAIKKILLPGIRTGGKSRYDDIKEARDTLTRWLEIHKGTTLA